MAACMICRKLRDEDDICPECQVGVEERKLIERNKGPDPSKRHRNTESGSPFTKRRHRIIFDDGSRFKDL